LPANVETNFHRSIEVGLTTSPNDYWTFHQLGGDVLIGVTRRICWFNQKPAGQFSPAVAIEKKTVNKRSVSF